MSNKPQNNRSAKPCSVRIIGGNWRGRNIMFHPAEGLRPSLDQVREMLFNWLQFKLRDKTCLDLFAGSGVLGFEALSRGAAQVDWVEQNKSVAKCIGENCQKIGLSNGQVYQLTAEKFIDKSRNRAKKYDMIFLDPPYQCNLLPKTCQLISQYNLLTDNGFIYLEAESEFNIKSLPEQWCLRKEKHHKQFSCYLFQLSGAIIENSVF